MCQKGQPAGARPATVEGPWTPTRCSSLFWSSFSSVAADSSTGDAAASADAFYLSGRADAVEVAAAPDASEREYTFIFDVFEVPVA